jgi:histidinol-phosphate phosphatase family protein
MNKAVFLDRDGLINKKAPEHCYIKSWDEFNFIPGVISSIRRLNELGFLVIVVTNQAGIGRGLMTEEDLKEIHQKMISEIEQNGGRIDAIYYCPHLPEEGCDCRKPAPGMVLRAAEDFNIDLESSILVGDSLTDIQCGVAAGVGLNILTQSLKEIIGKLQEH